MTLPTVFDYLRGGVVLDRTRMAELAWSLEQVMPFLPEGLDQDTVKPLRKFKTDLLEALHIKETEL